MATTLVFRAMLNLYNTLTRKKEAFVPITPGVIKMYVCGMTVYDLCHIGHARVLVVFDVMTRFMRQLGYDVTYVRNITDIDDKIIARAIENGEDFNVLTERFIKAMHEDAAQLGVLPPDLEPKATESMEQIIAMISALIENGHAYASDNGDVYYDVSNFEGYGKLSGKDIHDLRAGSRVEVNEAKQDPLDFVLWKAAKQGEPAWSSPWGEGRPGWHIECSAMGCHHLGNHFDIHGGGMDLQFPHHENEIAQSEGAHNETFVNYWLHNGFVRIDDEKMSKSLGNFFTIREVLKLYRGEEIRYFILTSQYRSPLNYSDDQLDKAKAALTRLYTALRDVVPSDVSAQNPKQVSDESTSDKSASEYQSRFYAAMNDDFNTPEALAVLFDIARDLNKAKEDQAEHAAVLAAELKSLAALLGLLQESPEAYLQGGVNNADGLSDVDIENMITARNAARSNKDWAESDRLRDALKDQGVILEDAAGGTSWRRE